RRGARVGAAAGPAGDPGARRGPFLPPQAPRAAHDRHLELEMSVLAVRALRKSFGALEVVRGVDLGVATGECFGLLGPNGAGKTTTLRRSEEHTSELQSHLNL